MLNASHLTNKHRAISRAIFALNSSSSFKYSQFAIILAFFLQWNSDYFFLSLSLSLFW